MGEAHEMQGSPYCTSMGLRESDFAGKYEEHFDQIVEELENLGQQMLTRGREQEVESGLSCICSSLRQRFNRFLLLLISLIILVFLGFFIYIAIKKKYILIT